MPPPPPRALQTLELVHADIEQLLSGVGATAKLAERISSRVRRLDAVQVPPTTNHQQASPLKAQPRPFACLLPHAPRTSAPARA